MTTDELERIASTGEEMPDSLEMPEELLYLTLRTLYQNFHNGAVNRDRAKREKSRIYVAYRDLEQKYKLMGQQLQIRERLSNHMSELYECGCPHCRKLLNIFIGIDREDIPKDIKEVHALNDRLRELVKERSERNAELATVIDQVRWTLESDRTEKEKIERVKEIVGK